MNMRFNEVNIPSPPRQFSYTIAHGTQEVVSYNLNFMRILELSDPTGVTIRFGDAGTPTSVVGAGVAYGLPYIVSNITIRNDSGGPIDITVAVAVGQIFDDRLNVSGNINIINAPGTCLAITNCPEDENGLVVTLPDPNVNRSLLTSLEDASYAEGTASATIVAGGSNVNGIAVRIAGVRVDGAGTLFEITAGGDTLLWAVGTTSYLAPKETRDIFIPPGEALAVSGSGSFLYYIWYEVL